MKKNKTIKELVEEKNPAPGFFSRWNIGETFPEKLKEGDKNVISFEEKLSKKLKKNSGKGDSRI